MKQLKVTYYDGMVNINSDDISFAWIGGMYKGNRAGVGMQVTDNISREKAYKMCVKIAEAVCEFNGRNDNKPADRTPYSDGGATLDQVQGSAAGDMKGGGK